MISCPWPFPVIEPAHEVLTFERVPAILDSKVERGHCVVHVIYKGVRTKEIGSKDDGPVGKSNLRILERVAIRLLLSRFMAVAEVRSEPGSHLLMIFEIAKPGAELPCCRHPYERRYNRIEIIVQLGRAHS